MTIRLHMCPGPSVSHTRASSLGFFPSQVPNPAPVVLLPSRRAMALHRHLPLLLAAVLALRLAAGVVSAASSPAAGAFDPSRVVQLSWRPRAFLHKGFLSDAECDHLIVLAKDKLEKSMVADNESGKSVQSEVRTSSGMFLEKKQDEVVTRIEERISAWTFLPPENGESIQILHYQNGEKYEPHYDYFHDKNNQALGGHRIATVLMYLSNVEKGGETIFPNAEGKITQHKDETSSECARNGYAVKPVKGDALLFFSLHPDGTTDPDSLHGSCPVIEGQKWSATKWIHVRSFDLPLKQVGSSDGCEDDNVLCPQWAAVGECAKNPNYMVGTKEAPGFCRKSCKVCTE
ncbi:probable prolyl 4-hydroxylase 6 isoform X2 [Phragmites australis]|uniref:probable prolyl 4-hydroxylase 6 isoform X2 n=1 Tax=Phragmites australis TaxID=29695 RepID=UPI002D793C90|nr:probable prolyl 4-hydroxylase 6 isoform X2 [Phragmites australis]